MATEAVKKDVESDFEAAKKGKSDISQSKSPGTPQPKSKSGNNKSKTLSLMNLESAQSSLTNKKKDSNTKYKIVREKVRKIRKVKRVGAGGGGGSSFDVGDMGKVTPKVIRRNEKGPPKSYERGTALSNFFFYLFFCFVFFFGFCVWFLFLFLGVCVSFCVL